MRVDGTALVQWADRQDAWSRLPVLIRRLVRETTPSLGRMTFPGGDAVNLPGFDGRTLEAKDSIWVPAGDAVWEMGCSSGPVAKAKGDFKKRSDEISAAEQASLSFVFVTPRRWPQREEWVREAKALGGWKDVRAYDATDLETWLEEAPITRRWLGELLGLAEHGLRTPAEWWSSWSSASKPPISCELVASRRNGEGDRLMEKLRGGDRVVTIAGDDRKEAVAFVLAALMQAGADDLLDRILVLTRPDVSLGARRSVPPILVVDLPDGEEVDLGDRSKVVVVRPYAKGRLSERAGVELSYVGSEAFRQRLVDMGLDDEKAGRLATETGHSITVLRRRLSDDPEERRPVWARNDDARRLLPFALAGSWLEGDRNDEAILLRLADKPSDALQQDRDALLRLEDAPLARYGTVNLVVSQVDALFAIGPFIRTQDLDRFFEVALEVCGERDPALDLPRDEWWRASVRPFSESLTSGLGNALCILAVHGRAICGEQLALDLETRINRLVRQLMTDLSEEQWLSRRKLLQIFAEAAPASFLDCLEAELHRPQPAIAAIMGSVGGGVSGKCLRVDLLWALESLAWSAEHFGRVAGVVMDLRRFDSEDTWSNSTAATAAALFRDWLPSTVVDVEGRLTTLRRLSQTYRGPVIDVCLSLLPNPHKTGRTTARPRWRTLGVEVLEATRLDVHKSMVGASRLLLDLAPFDAGELAKLLDAMGRLHPDDQERLLADVQRWSQSARAEEMARLRDVARARLGRIAFRRDTDQEIRRRLEQVQVMLEPVQPEHQHRWLFQQLYVEWCELTGGEAAGRFSIQEHNRIAHERRLAALTEIEAARGRDGLFAFAMSAGSPQAAAFTLVRDETPVADVADWVERALRHPEPEPAKAFLAALLSVMSRRGLPEFVGGLSASLLRSDQDRLTIAEVLPGTAEGWRAVERLGPEPAARYWGGADFQGLRGDKEELQFAVERLLAAGRPRTAFAAAHWDLGHLPGDLWRRVLEAIIAGDEPQGPFLQEYHISRVLKRLDDDPALNLAQIARLELRLMRVLRGYGGRRSSDRTLALHRLIACNPSEFIRLVAWSFRRDDDGEDAVEQALSSDGRKRRAQLAYHVLNSWEEIPGFSGTGEVDAETFMAWNAEARRLAQEAGRQSIAERMLGQAYARFASRWQWEEWLPGPLADLLDPPDSANLREGFRIGVYNARGVTRRVPQNGGAQERELAAQFRGAADRYRILYPRLSAAIRAIAETYEREAKREDDQAALGERWHP